MKIPIVWVIERRLKKSSKKSAWIPTDTAKRKKWQNQGLVKFLKDQYPVFDYRITPYYGIPMVFQEKQWREVERKAQELRHEIYDLLNWDFKQQGSGSVKQIVTENHKNARKLGKTPRKSEKNSLDKAITKIFEDRYHVHRGNFLANDKLH